MVEKTGTAGSAAQRAVRRGRPSKSHLNASKPSSCAEDSIERVLTLLRARTRHEFFHYKRATVQRRIERRIHARGLDSLAAYARHVEEDPGELDVLFSELLIGVSSFFRDPSAFASAGRHLRELVAQRPSDHVLRAWVPACSTGEEAYSLCILLHECIDGAKRPVEFRLFATDLDSGAIDVARLGIYPASIARHVTKERLARFFTLEDGFYQVRKEIRDLVVFAKQDVIADPPFTRLDLLSCRNLLIYFDTDLQKRVLPLFHYALAPSGLLFLGASESVGLDERFTPLDRKWRIYRREEAGPALGALFPVKPPAVAGTERGEPARSHGAALVPAIHHVFLRRLVPPSVLVRENGDVVFVHGQTGMFLEPAPGKPSRANIFSMARSGLQCRLDSVVRRAHDELGEVVERDVCIETNGRRVLVDLRATRLGEPDVLRGLVLVAFANAREQATLSSSSARFEDSARELEIELRHLKQHYEVAVQELTTAYEQAQSTNEELQSANEELGTSQEELHAVYGELQRVNQELQEKLDELARANDDMRNLLNGSDVATLFLDRELRVKRFTDQLPTIVPLLPSDVGRPIADLACCLQHPSFVADAREVLRTLIFVEAEVRSTSGRWHLMRILPYRTTENVVDGLVVTFVDITGLKTLQDDERRRQSRLANSPNAEIASGVTAELGSRPTATEMKGGR